MSKGNGKIGTSREVMERRVETARDCYNRQRVAAAEAVAETFLLYKETLSGPGKKWFDDEIEKFNNAVQAKNDELKSEQDRAKNFIDGKLAENDHLNLAAANEEEAKAHEKEREELRIVHKRSTAERTELKLLSATKREDSSQFMPIVRYVFNFNAYSHKAMVSRYCLVLEWIDSQFSGKANVDVEMIVQAITAIGGFDNVVDIQREVGKTTTEAQKDAEIIRDAIAKQAKSIAREQDPIAMIELQAKQIKDGFVLLLGRVSDRGVAILGEAEATDNEIDSAVSKFGKTTLLGADEPSMEFIGRVIEMAAVIKDKQEIMGGPDGKQKITTDRIFSLKADEDGSPILVVSLTHADSGPVFYAKPKVENILSFDKGACVLSGGMRRRMEKELDDAARRRFLTLKVNTNPKTKEGLPAESALSWELHNQALANANRSTANQSFYWTSLAKTQAKPLDIDNFTPRYHCALGQNEIQEIFEQLLKPWKSNTDSKKATRVFSLKLEDQELSVICGDADAMPLSAKITSAESFVMNFRILDIYNVFSVFCDKHWSDYRLSGDPSGLLRISWSDQYGDYAIHLPTVGTDGKLQSRRVGPMLSAPVLLAAE